MYFFCTVTLFPPFCQQAPRVVFMLHKVKNSVFVSRSSFCRSASRWTGKPVTWAGGSCPSRGVRARSQFPLRCPSPNGEDQNRFLNQTGSLESACWGLSWSLVPSRVEVVFGRLTLRRLWSGTSLCRQKTVCSTKLPFYFEKKSHRFD